MEDIILKKYDGLLEPKTYVYIGLTRVAIPFCILTEHLGESYNKDYLLDNEGEPYYFGNINFSDDSNIYVSSIIVLLGENCYLWEAYRTDILNWEAEDFLDGLIPYNEVGTTEYLGKKYKTNLTII